MSRTDRSASHPVWPRVGMVLLGALLLSACHKKAPSLAPSQERAHEGAAADSGALSPPSGASGEQTATTKEPPNDGTTRSTKAGTEKRPSSTREMSGPSTAEQTALQFAGYREVWRLPAPSEGKIQELYLASDGRSVAYRSTTTVTIAEQNGRRRRLPSPVGEIVAPMPDLQVWLSKPLGEAGKVRAWGPDGQMRWEVDAPAGPINVGGPSGQVIVISQGTPTNGPGTRKTALFDPDGRPGWQTDQFGGEVSFDAAGEFLVWDVAQRSWHVLAPSGQLRHSGTVEGARQRPYLLSADGRYVIDQESGILESLDRRPPGQKPAGPALIQGPGPFVASNGRDLYLFLRYLGEFSRLQAIRSDGSVLWTIPAPDYRAVLIPPDGKVVLVAGTAGLQSLDGTTGAIRETLTGVKQVHLSPDGGHLLIQLTDQFVILSRP